MKIKINEYFENSFNLDSRINVENLEIGAIKYGGATQIDDIIFSNYNNVNEFIINENNTVGIIVPGTIDIDKNIDNSIFVDMIINILNENNIYDIDNKEIKGSWITDAGICVIEDNNLITFKSNNIDKHLRILKRLANIIKKEMNQEAISILINEGLVIY